MPKSKISKEAIELTLAVLATPSLHWKACYTDISGRPQPLNCVCLLGYAINKVLQLKTKQKEKD